MKSSKEVEIWGLTKEQKLYFNQHIKNVCKKVVQRYH